MLNFCSCGSMESNHDSKASSGRRASCARATGAGPMRDIRFTWYRPVPTKGRSTEYRFLDLQDYRITIFESVVLIDLDLESAWYLTQDHAVDSRSNHSIVAVLFLAHTPHIILASRMAQNMSVCREAAVRAQ